MDKTTSDNKLGVASFFCGLGGMDIGILGGFDFLNHHYQRLPFKINYATDFDPYAASIYNSNFEHECKILDIRNIQSRDVPKHDVLLGGFPCQSFSISAQNPPRLGYKDERGMLFFELVRMLKHHKPRVFIAENVKGLISANKKQALPLIIKEFENVGYNVTYKLLKASDFDVPQKRERVFIVGFRYKKDFKRFKFPTNANPNRNVLKDVIDSEANLEEKWFFSEKAVAGMLRVRSKMNKGRAQNINEPCNTISSHLSKVSLNSTDPVLKIKDRYRRFTPREAASIQSFPEDFNLNSVSENRQYRAIGNAVPPVLMWYVAKSVLDALGRVTPP